MTGTFDAWLNAEMASRGIRSARRLGMEAGLDPDKVADWVLGSSMPSDEECDTLAKYLGADPQEVRERRVPHRRNATQG